MSESLPETGADQPFDALPAPAPMEPVRPQPAVHWSERFGALIEVLLCSGFPTQIVLITLLSALGMQMRTAAGGLSATFVFVLSLLDAALVVGLVLFFLRRHDESVREVLVGPRPVAREAALGVALIPAIFFVVVLVLAVIFAVSPSLHNVARNPLEAMIETPRDAVIFSIVVMVAGGVREEVQRGFIIHRFGQYLGGATVGVVVYSVAFGLGHLEQGYDAAVATGALGAIWGTMYLVRRSIVAPMVSHAGFNLLQLVKFMSLR